MIMKLGMCLPIERLENGAELGADYVEVNCCNIYSLNDGEFSALKKNISDNDIKTYSCNVLVPGEVRLTGDDVCYADVREYAKKAFGRLAEIGVSMLVFGSSAAKRVPEGFPYDKAWEQLYEVGAIFSDVAGEYGQTVAVEPLRYAEVNIINTLKDGAEYVNTVNRSNFKLLADFFHVTENGEPLSDIVKYKDILVHTHIACPETRRILTETHREYAAACINALKAAGYTGCMSFEGSSDAYKGVPEMLEMLRQLS